MLITFKSSASNDVLMFENAAKEFLRCIGKAPDEATGIITVEQLPAAIDSVRRAIAADRSESRTAVDNAAEEETGEDDEQVGFSQRAQPMLELLERSRADGAPVVWGV
ncbi:MAG TPA: DUF1840 domain-containing protein [Rhodocyclaceae bacterium]|nr:DUF1840 domain-containing protein [Rhodocyclaceae bacterium]